MENNKQILFGDEAIERYNILKEKGLILYECIIGSHSYGLNIETSDIDEVFIYIEDIDNILADNCSIQLNITDDYKGYEIWRYLELLSKQNPVTIEYLFTNEKFVKFCHPLFKELLVNHGDEFLSKKVAFSFGAYAKTQICKAQGANKKFMNPMPGPRKSLLEFAYVPYNEGSITLEEYLEINDIPHNWIGLSAIDHMKYTYNLYIDPIYYKHLFLGIDKLYIKKFINEKWPDYKSIYNGPVDIDGVQPKLSSIPKGEKSEVIVQFNLDAFQKYCNE